MARGLELRVVAEGVETEAQAAFLREIGCDAVQGFFFARPGAASAVAQICAARRGAPALP
ncbi:EAL domain-containing protein [Rhodobacter xanthinilyticus]|nr:EAL domain-containing protein [Rhodobacter xanthinilyticus]